MFGDVHAFRRPGDDVIWIGPINTGSCGELKKNKIKNKKDLTK